MGSVMTERRLIRIFPDYGHDWPLWENTTSTHDYGYTMEPSDYGLSSQLTERIRAWYDFWEVNQGWDRGWDSPEYESNWIAEGKDIAAAMRAQVNDFADVRLEIGDR
jgi:hypothetical protein